MQGEVAVTMSRAHLTALRCGMGMMPLSAFLTGQVVVSTHLDITTCVWEQQETCVQCLSLVWTSPGEKFFSSGLSLCVPIIQSERKKELKSTPAIASWGGIWFRVLLSGGSLICTRSKLKIVKIFCNFTVLIMLLNIAPMLKLNWPALKRENW